MSNWEHVSSRLGNIKPATRAIAKEIYDAAAAAGHDIWFMWGIGTSTEHRTGRALDLMVRNKAAGDWIRNYIWSNRARLRLRHVIWWQRITSTVVQPGVVRLMPDRGNVTVNHKDHLHVFFNDGAYQAPTRAPQVGSTTSNTPVSGGGIVHRIQRWLKVNQDGKWGPVTDRAAMQMRIAARANFGWPTNVASSFDVRLVQDIVNTKVDGVWGPNSRSALDRWIRNFQDIIGVKSDGKWGPKTDGKFLSLRQKNLNRW